MTLSSRTRRRLLTWSIFVVVGAIVGGIYATAVIMPSQPGAGTWLPGARPAP